MYRTAPNHRRLAWRFLAGRVARVIAGAGLLGAAALAAAGAAPGAAAGTASASTAGRVPAVGPASAATPLWIHVSAGQRVQLRHPGGQHAVVLGRRRQRFSTGPSR